MRPKPTAYSLSVKGDLMSKIVHEHVFDMQLFKKSEIGWVVKQHLQFNIKGCGILCLREKQPKLLER